MWLLRVLANSKTLTREQLNWLRNHSQSTNHWVNKSLCYLLLGKFGDEADIDFCWRNLGNHVEVNRAIALSCQRLQTAKRNQRYKEIVERFGYLSPLVTMLKGSAKAVWQS